MILVTRGGRVGDSFLGRHQRRVAFLRVSSNSMALCGSMCAARMRIWDRQFPLRKKGNKVVLQSFRPSSHVIQRRVRWLRDHILCGSRGQQESKQDALIRPHGLHHPFELFHLLVQLNQARRKILLTLRHFLGLCNKYTRRFIHKMNVHNNFVNIIKFYILF